MAIYICTAWGWRCSFRLTGIFQSLTQWSEQRLRLHVFVIWSENINLFDSFGDSWVFFIRMSTKFFNNTPSNTLFEKLKGIADNMHGFNRFLAVVGYFRSSGYFKLHKELGDISDIRILIGINADDIFRKHNMGWEMLEAPERAKELYNEQFIQDILDSNYTKVNCTPKVFLSNFWGSLHK